MYARDMQALGLLLYVFVNVAPVSIMIIRTCAYVSAEASIETSIQNIVIYLFVFIRNNIANSLLLYHSLVYFEGSNAFLVSKKLTSLI